MVVGFLRKLRTEILEEKFELDAELKEAQIKLDENRKFVQNMKWEEERSFDAFSPRRQNIELRDSICKLEEEQLIIQTQYEKIKFKLDATNSRLAEFDHVLEEAKNQKAELKKVVMDRSESNNLKDNRIFDIFNQNFSGIMNKTEFCFRLAELDPKRCKFELSSMLKEMNGIMELFSEIGDIENGTDKIDGC